MLSLRKITLLAGLSLLASCQTTAVPSTTAQPVGKALAQSVQSDYLQTRLTSFGLIKKTGPTQITVDLTYDRDVDAFSTQALDCGSVAFASIEVSGPGLASPIYADTSDSQNKVPVSGCAVSAVLSDLPYGNLIITTKLYDANSMLLSGSELVSALRFSADSDSQFELSYRQSPTGEVIQQLQQSGLEQEFLAQQLDISLLQAFIDRVTGMTESFPNYAYTTHPSLVNSLKLANDLQSKSLSELSPADYRLSGASVRLNVSGLDIVDKIQVQLTDPASAIQTNLGNGNTVTVTGVTPGTGIGIKVAASGNSSQAYSYTVSPATLTLTEGGSQTLSIVATPFALTRFTSPSAAVGQTVRIEGSGFSGSVLSVAFNGVNAPDVSVLSDTELDVIVPAAATDGEITVTKAGFSKSLADFNVIRTIYVSASAMATNDGTSWTNAFINLRAALRVADSGDEIWIAAGKYKPTPRSNRSASFELKENVNIYGGFEGTENTKAGRTPDLMDFETVLSGDLDGNDDYDNPPGTSLDDNAYHVVTGANSTVLEGVKIEGGNANGMASDSNGAGLYNRQSSPTLTNITFANNSAANDGGGLYNKKSSPTLTNVSFTSNSAANDGGGLFNNDSSPTLTNVSFANNLASSNGGGLFNSDSSPTLANVTFEHNSAANDGGGLYNKKSVPTLTNVSFAYNSAVNDGGGLFNKKSSPVLTTVSFANNSASSNGGGLFNNDSSPTLTAVSFANNSASSNGGGVFNNDSFPILTNVSFANNLATKDGGGIYNKMSSPTLTGVSFTYNSASKNGGGLFNNESSPSLTNVSFTHNMASENGGGLFNIDSSPTLATVSFADNSANYGGGLSNSKSSPTLTDVTFANNSAEYYGGGILNSKSSPTLTGVSFATNLAANGGGIYNDYSTPTLTKVSFVDNSASVNGGGLYNYRSSPTLTNLTFTHNLASVNGGALYNNDSSPMLINVTFANNLAASGGGIYNKPASLPILKNVLLWKSTGYAQALNASDGVIALADANDPFVNSALPNGVDGIARTSDDGLRIKAGASDVIDQGVGVLGLDILGLAQVGQPEPGAYEYISP